MDLRELTNRMLEILEIKSTDEIQKRLIRVVKNDETSVYDQFCNIVQDLSVDWLQMIFQYYHADRKEKKQDYTPKSLARFMGRLAGKSDLIIDLCAGSGALTIQRWSMNQEQHFELYEFDENVIPFLLFNMAVRNIECTVFHCDVLQQQTYHTFRIIKRERFGKIIEVTS